MNVRLFYWYGKICCFNWPDNLTQTIPFTLLSPFIVRMKGKRLKYGVRLWTVNSEKKNFRSWTLESTKKKKQKKNNLKLFRLNCHERHQINIRHSAFGIQHWWLSLIHFVVFFISFQIKIQFCEEFLHLKLVIGRFQTENGYQTRQC